MKFGTFPLKENSLCYQTIWGKVTQNDQENFKIMAAQCSGLEFEAGFEKAELAETL